MGVLCDSLMLLIFYYFLFVERNLMLLIKSCKKVIVVISYNLILIKMELGRFYSGTNSKMEKKNVQLAKYISPFFPHGNLHGHP